MCPARAEAWPVRTQPVTPGGEALPRQAHCRGGGARGCAEEGRGGRDVTGFTARPGLGARRGWLENTRGPTGV